MADTEASALQAPLSVTAPEPQPNTVETDKSLVRPQLTIPVNGEYGPTRSAETLWSIASQLAAAQHVSAHKMLTALYQANPEAFNDRDINSLMVGVMLKVPALGMISATNTGLQAEVGLTQPTTQTDNSTPPQSVTQPALIETDTARPQIEQLEQKLDSMQKLLASKDQQLARLQTATPPARAEAPAGILYAIGGLVAVILSVLVWLYRRHSQTNTRQIGNTHQETTDFTVQDSEQNSAAGISGEFDFNFDFASQIPGIEEDDDYNSGLDDLENEACIESNIDLAKAYIDMGDIEAAKAALTEVLQKGSKQQLATAQALLDEIG